MKAYLLPSIHCPKCKHILVIETDGSGYIPEDPNEYVYICRHFNCPEKNSKYKAPIQTIEIEKVG